MKWTKYEYVEYIKSFEKAFFFVRLFVCLFEFISKLLAIDGLVDMSEMKFIICLRFTTKVLAQKQ